MPYITKAYKRQKLVRSKEKRSNHIEIVIESSDARESQILYEQLKRAIQKMNRRTRQKVSYRIEESVRNLVSLEVHASLDKSSICRNLLSILGIFCCRIFLLLLV